MRPHFCQSIDKKGKLFRLSEVRGVHADVARALVHIRPLPRTSTRARATSAWTPRTSLSRKSLPFLSIDWQKCGRIEHGSPPYRRPPVGSLHQALCLGKRGASPWARQNAYPENSQLHSRTETEARY